MKKDFILESIVREMHSGALVLDNKGTVLYANPHFLNSFPVKGRVEGRPVSSIIGDETFLKTVEGFIEEAGESLFEETEISERGRFFKVRLVPLKDKGTSPEESPPSRKRSRAGGPYSSGDFSLLVFLQDITEEKRVETIKKDFVANVSHELRTPLASIKGYSETLLDGAVEEEETLREFLRVIDRHATRMARLIDDLLILSKLESHQMPIVSSPVDIKELITSTAKTFDKQARDKGISISSQIPDGLPKVLGDRDRLEQVVVNLLDNAIKYTHSGGSVRLVACAVKGSVRVDVSDTGIGIPPEDMPRIFERFYRVDKARSRELGGTGLGLAIVKHIIQGHNGKMRVESMPGKGSTFSFTLAAVKEPPQDELDLSYIKPSSVL